MQETHKKLVLWISRFYVSNKEKKNRFALLLTGFEKGLCSLISSPKEWSRKAGRSFMREIFILNRYQRVSETVSVIHGLFGHGWSIRELALYWK